MSSSISGLQYPILTAKGKWTEDGVFQLHSGELRWTEERAFRAYSELPRWSLRQAAKCLNRNLGGRKIISDLVEARDGNGEERVFSPDDVRTLHLARYSKAEAPDANGREVPSDPVRDSRGKECWVLTQLQAHLGVSVAFVDYWTKKDRLSRFRSGRLPW